MDHIDKQWYATKIKDACHLFIIGTIPFDDFKSILRGALTAMEYDDSISPRSFISESEIDKMYKELETKGLI